MDYKKIIKDNYTLHLIKTDRFKTINIGLKLTKEYNKEEFAYLNLLARVLPINGTKNYKTVNDITKKLESLYNTGIYFKSLQTSKNMSFEASLRIVNPKYTEISMYKESISMLKEIITNPLIKNNEYNNIDVTKNNLINNIKNIKDNLPIYSSLKFNEIFYKGTIYEENSLKNLPLYERRTIFEEAAGVLKYKRRKEEALKKLEKTNENLTRVKDIIKELEEQREAKILRLLKHPSFSQKYKDLI